MTDTPDTLTRAERLKLAATIVSGILAGISRAFVAWWLDQHLH